MKRLVLVSLTAALCFGTPLIDAVKKADVPAVRSLLAQHADVNAPEADGSTALHLAAYSA